MLDWLFKRSEFLKNIFKKIKKDISIILISQSHQQEQLKALADVQQLSSEKIARFEGMFETLKQVQVQNKSKTSLRQVQEKYIIHRLRQSKKTIAKQKILDYAVKQKIPIPEIKVKLMSELNISKASFYNYINELMTDGSLSPSLSPKSVLFRQNLDKQ